MNIKVQVATSGEPNTLFSRDQLHQLQKSAAGVPVLNQFRDNQKLGQVLDAFLENDSLFAILKLDNPESVSPGSFLVPGIRKENGVYKTVSMGTTLYPLDQTLSPIIPAKMTPGTQGGKRTTSVIKIFIPDHPPTQHVSVYNGYVLKPYRKFIEEMRFIHDSVQIEVKTHSAFIRKAMGDLYGLSLKKFCGMQSIGIEHVPYSHTLLRARSYRGMSDDLLMTMICEAKVTLDILTADPSGFLANKIKVDKWR